MTERVVTIPMIAHSEYTDSSQLIHSGPCIVKNVHCSYGVAGSGTAKVYDGLNNNGLLKAKIITFATSSSEWNPGDGTDFDYGIYVELDANIAVTVTYIPESRKAFI